MNTARTRGPWAIDEHEEGAPYLYVVSHDETEPNGIVCRIAMNEPRNLADAQAIAALPELLAALEAIVLNDPYHQSSAGIIARAALARVTA